MKDPAMLFYPKDWIEGTAQMTIEERGVYINLLAHQHQKDKLPNDLERLARLSNCDLKVFKKIWAYIQDKFVVDGDFVYNLKVNELKKERKINSLKNTISGTFASVLRFGNFNKNDYNELKKAFSVEDWFDIPKELLTERLTVWCTECLKNGKGTIEDANANEDINKDKYMTKDMFEMFWDKYPKKTDKKKAKEKFLKLDSELFNTIMYALDYQIQSKQWKEGFIPNPTTWINGERWEDKLESNKAEDTKIKRLTDEDFEGGEYAKFYK